MMPRAGSKTGARRHGARAPDPSRLRALFEKAVQEKRLTFPVLLDSKGTVGRQFEVEDLPTYVLLDTQGRIRRRFAGSRTKPVWEALINEAADTHAASAP
jgi:peroxiredoxin